MLNNAFKLFWERSSQILQAHRVGLVQIFQGLKYRQFATVQDLQNEIDDLNDKFATARDEIELAKEDAETVYFNESHATAKQVVDEVMEKWQNVLERLDEEEKMKLQRSMGLKMEQLKAEFLELDNLHSD
eukprot:TRINITY_DN23184_c0_g3_i1.p3 TRINITY_DN23184_c0_g3~~TRINITY_DN23184_c0_g3_i1.p3  ORF type:complete len:130 (-),score=16.77 TRINITY_DN23184_c0_g3_i1:404-793(-)